MNALRARGLAEERPSNELVLTGAGTAMRERVLAERRRGLSDLLARWQPEQHPDVLALIDRGPYGHRGVRYGLEATLARS